jgi:aarF domain-containing kinase
MKEELADECDYTREAASIRSFGSLERLGANLRFEVPWVWEGSTDRVLVMKHMDGISVGEDVINRLPQEDRNEVRSRPPYRHKLRNTNVDIATYEDCSQGN